MKIKKSTIIPFFLSLAFFVFLVVPMFTSAASDKDYFPICECCQKSTPCTFIDFFIVVDKLMRAFLYLSFFIAVLMIIKGGITILLGASSDSARKKGRETITYAIYGMLVAFGAWLIVNTVLTVFTGGGVSSYLNIKP